MVGKGQEGKERPERKGKGREVAANYRPPKQRKGSQDRPRSAGNRPKRRSKTKKQMKKTCQKPTQVGAQEKSSQRGLGLRQCFFMESFTMPRPRALRVWRALCGVEDSSDCLRPLRPHGQAPDTHGPDSRRRASSRASQTACPWTNS